MIIFTYDKTFEGLLCALFDAFELKIVPEKLLAEKEIPPLFISQLHHVKTIKSKHERVLLALHKKLTQITLYQLMCVWLSESADYDMLIFQYLYHFFKSKKNTETHFSDPIVLKIRQTALKVNKERHNIMQFIRFNAIEQCNEAEGINEQIYFAAIAPIYNALPLTIDFFKDRFADQKWAIYDKNRSYGYYYDLKSVEPISLDHKTNLMVNKRINQTRLTKDERFFQNMWYRYCKALTITERLNPQLQRKLMPTRFWQYLPEVQLNKKEQSQLQCG